MAQHIKHNHGFMEGVHVMQQPLQITFRDFPHSDAVEANIRAHAAKLELFFDRIISCRVLVEAPHAHHHHGKLYHVRIDLMVPGKELVVNRGPSEHHAHEDIYVAIRDAFAAAQRQLQNYKRQQEGNVKIHETQAHGRIVSLMPAEDYGRIESSDGRDIYFHRNSLVQGSYDDLHIGSDVRFIEEMGEDGPQASSVYVEGKHHLQDHRP
jgi:cold shock CspA family protein/ribosome-associated translation inhibitor RaiA